MKKFVYFRINEKYFDFVQNNIPEVVFNPSNPIIILSTDDENVTNIHNMNKLLDNNLYFYWDLLYEYTSNEINNAKLFRVKYLNVIESCGEEGGTQYDNSKVCPICGAGKRQIGDLHLSSNTSLKKGVVYKTIGGEIIVPSFFRDISIEHNLYGMDFLHVWLGDELLNDYLQLTSSYSIEVSTMTRFGIDYFDTENISSVEERMFNICGHNIHFPKEIYVCPQGDLVGLRLLSELFVLHNDTINNIDFMKTSKYIGVKRGFINPEPLYVCSKKFYDVVKKENIYGMEFEIAINGNR